MSEHTPGPWWFFRNYPRDSGPSQVWAAKDVGEIDGVSWEDLSETDQVDLAQRREDWPIHIVSLDDGNGEATNETDANAMLIAAAPDLLAEAKSFLAAWTQTVPFSPDLATACWRLSAAIAKAEGRLP